jgi:hypothetical protein
MNPSLEQNNYLYVPNFLTVQEADELAQWMFEQERLGILEQDPRNNFNLFGLAIRNGLPFVKFLVKKIPEVSKLCGEEVLPTYVYSVIYKNKAELIRHVDKDACDISLSVNLQKDTDWPLCIKKPNGEEICIKLNPGDAIMYFGCDAQHWRQGQFKGQNFLQTFMHYVRANGPRAYAYFDNKQKV